MYTIGRVAALTGVPVATLRAWERRYRVVLPARTDAGYRLYDAEALSAITRMRALLDSGFGPKAAAAEVVAEREAARPDSAPRTVDPGTSGPGDRFPQGDGEPSVARFLAAAIALDSAELGRALDDMFLAMSFEAALDRRLMPAVRALGDAWEAGDLGVGGEHVASAAVMRRLGTAFEAAAGDVAGPRIVTGLPAGSRHEIGILAFATAARRCGIAVLHLGADLPNDMWVHAVAAYGAEAAVMAVSTAADVDSARSAVDAMTRAHPHLLVFAGGDCQDAVSPPAQALGQDIAIAARHLADTVETQSKGTRS
jgi:DNA-binding transcriptional MerR regulator/methylmalonyl-CoA mutase cobalamin-binding subunit